MPNNSGAWLKRAKEVVAEYKKHPSGEIAHFALSLLTALYGQAQLDAFTKAQEYVAASTLGVTQAAYQQGAQAFGVVKNVLAEMEVG